MSHITRVKTELKDGLVLRKALKRLDYKINDGGVITGGYRHQQGERVDMIANKAGLRIGFRRLNASESAPYEIFADWEGYRKKRQEIIGQIYQTYTQEKVFKAARARGYSIIKNHVNQNGQIEMVLRKVA